MCAVLVGGNYRAGASLISPRFLLTAAHKVSDLRLEEEEKEVVEQIPDEDIIRFLLSADETAKRRKELRENLRRRFADFCNCHGAENCPSKSF